MVWEINQEIRTGTLSMRLLRPIHPLVSYAAENLAAIPLRLVVALPVAALALILTGASRLPRDPLLWLVFLLSLLGGWLITFLANAGIGTLALWTGSSVKVMDVWLALFMVFSGYLIPVELFPAAIRGTVEVLPFRYQIGFPVELLTRGLDRQTALRAPPRTVDLGGPVHARSPRAVAAGAAALRGLRRMTGGARYWRLFRIQVRISVLLGLQYRADFVLDGVVSLFWTLTALVPLFTVYHLRQSVAGWTFEEALVVIGWFTLLKAILDGAVNPQPDCGGRAHPQRHARLRAAQARRRAVPGLHRPLRAVAEHQRRDRAGALDHRLRPDGAIAVAVLARWPRSSCCSPRRRCSTRCGS